MAAAISHGQCNYLEQHCTNQTTCRDTKLKETCYEDHYEEFRSVASCNTVT